MYIFDPTNEQLLRIIIILSIWDFVWKGFALWKASQQKQRNWFIAMFILNTIGILPLLYLLFFSTKSLKNTK